MSSRGDLPLLEIDTLGGLAIRRGGQLVTEIRSRKVEALLVYLAFSGRPQSREVLAELLWYERSQKRAAGNLRRVLHDLRQHLGPYVTITRETVAIHPEQVWLDARELESRLSALHKPQEFFSGTTRESVEQALALYRGAFLQGFPTGDSLGFENWVSVERERLHHLVLDALRKVANWHLENGRYASGIPHAARALQLDPYMEDIQRQMMRLLAYNGQRQAALDHYDNSRRLLADELGVDPEEETTALYEQILAGELASPAPPQVAAVALELPSFLDRDAGPAVAQRPAFVARERELSRMHECLQEAINGRGQLLFIAGQAGAGKSSLTESFSRRAQEQHPELLVVMGAGTAHTGAGNPYLPFRSILAMLTGDVEGHWTAGLISREHALDLWQAAPDALQALLEKGPDLINHFVPGEALLVRAGQATGGKADWLGHLHALAVQNKTGSADLERGHFHDQYLALLQTLSAKRPLLIVLDDLQWADTASLNLLFHLAKNLTGSRILLVGAYRPDEVAAGRFSQSAGSRVQHPLQSVLDEFRRQFGDIWLDLDDDSRDRGAAFVNALLDTEPNALGLEFRKALQKHTGGHPLFAVELLRVMQERGGLIQDVAGCWTEGPSLDWRALPARVEGVIDEHIGLLEEELRETLSIASVEGEEFTAQVVAQVREADVRGLVHKLSAELDKKHHLIDEQGSKQVGKHRLYQYRFRHSLFQLHVYNAIGEFERELLHQDVGAVLETLYEGRTEEIATQLAWHFSEAGDSEKAVRYLLQAGDQARDLYAHDEAIEHYEKALDFLREEREYDLAARTLMKLGLTYHNAFAFRRARQAYDEGFALWQRAAQIHPAVSLPDAPHALRVDWFTDVNTLDPTIAADYGSSAVIDQLFSGLMEYTPQMELVPNVARSWEVVDGGRRYIFHLRDDVTWSDGVPVTAEDFAYAWKRVLTPATGSPAANLLYDIKGARAYHQGALPHVEQLGIKVVDDTTLEIELEGPTSYVPHLLAHNATYPVPRHVVEAEGGAWSTVDKIVTNGPFKLVSWIPGESMVLARNHDCPSRFMGNVEQVKLSLVGDSTARLEMFEFGDLDILFLYGFPPRELRQALQWHADEYLSGPFVYTLYLALDVNQSPLESTRLRQALVQAIDREALADNALQGAEFPATGGFVPPGMPGHSPNIGLPHNVDLARQLLADAGFPGGAGFPPINLLAMAGIEPVCEFLQGSWRESLGVEITWETLDIGRLINRLRAQPPALYLAGWVADYPDPDTFLRVSRQGGFWNSWRNEDYAALLKKASEALNQKERLAFYMEADRLLMNEAVIMPLTYGRRRMLVKPWVTKFPTSALKLSFWKDTVIEPH